MDNLVQLLKHIIFQEDEPFLDLVHLVINLVLKLVLNLELCIVDDSKLIRYFLINPLLKLSLKLDVCIDGGTQLLGHLQLH